jgi:hypothetical protein
LHKYYGQKNPIVGYCVKNHMGFLKTEGIAVFCRLFFPEKEPHGHALKIEMLS